MTPRPSTDPADPVASAALPAGLRLRTVLAEREGVRVVRAEGPGGEDWVVRLEPAGGEALAELGVLARLDHPGIVPVADHGALADGGRWVARPWVEGVDLATWARGAEPAEIGAVVARLTAALDHLHRRGFVHGDLKPENVLVTPATEPVLTDFGLARRSGRASGDGVRGSYFALSPEELYGLEVTAAADLFALGVLLARLLAPGMRDARDYYARFPESSFLDASGIDPEDLPSWARDLVGQLTARDPARRPASAGVVGARLAERLGLRWMPDPARALVWPVERGRERWLASRLATNRDAASPEWLVVPAEEDARALWNRLRLHAALRGRPVVGVDLNAESARAADPVTLDRRVAELAGLPGREHLALVEEPDPWTIRALESLERALARSAGEHALSVLASTPAPDEERWHVSAVPPVEPSTVQRFVDETFRAEAPERRVAFASALEAAGAGSARRLERALQRMFAEGALFEDEHGYRLRPGALPDPVAEVAERGSSEEPAAVVSAAAAVLGERASTERLRATTGLDAQAFDVGLEAALAGGWLTPLDGRLAPTGDAPRVPAEVRRALHRHAASDSSTPALHRACATGLDEDVTRFLATLHELADRGRAELALTHAERFEREFAACAHAAVGDQLALERVFAWCALGRPEAAQRLVDEHGGDEPRWDLARARIAVLRHETDAALEAFRRAARDPSLGADAAAGRVHLLHASGRDADVLAALQELPETPPLPPRVALYLRSLAAMSRFRLGRDGPARAETLALRDEAVALDDPALEAALRIDVAIQERLAGSLERARAELELAIERYDRAGLVFGLAQARTTLGGVLRELGRLAEAEAPLWSAIETRERLGDSDGANTARGTLGLLLADRGHARAAIETLESAAGAMRGAQRRRFAPLLLSKALEMRVRIGDQPPPLALDDGAEDADPRVLLARARAAWMRGDPAASSLAERGRDLARSLKLERVGLEADGLVARIAGRTFEPSAVEAAPLITGDLEAHALLRDDDADLVRLEALAKHELARGRDDRAARLFRALATRHESPALARAFDERAAEAVARAAEGLSRDETAAFERHLMGEPDPEPADLIRRTDLDDDEEDFEMQLSSLLEINKKLVAQRDLESLVGVIVEQAMELTGAERGFLVLEEQGELRFDTALDSIRGDIAQPEFEISRSVVYEALERGEPVRVKNAVDDPLLAHQGSVVSLELRSIVCVPMEIEPGLRGAIYLDHRLRKNAFGERSERLVQLLAGQAALAIQKTKRLDEIRSLNQRLEQRVLRREADLQQARRKLAEQGRDAEQPTLVGDSDAMRATRELIERAAPTDLPVLVVGESGTGKELAARALHDLSHRKAGPFVSENCAALPGSLIESELFGYRRGAFSGAERDRVGRIEQAHGGTLFLDEIGEVPLELQAKLLRVLETGEVRRLGDEDARSVDFRLVAATNRDLEAEVREGRFRRDLFYRLQGLEVRLPTLAQRPDDVPLLVRHFLALAGEDRHVSRPVLAALARRAWPGNVRELKNEVARLCVLGEGDLDDPSLLSAPARFERSSGANDELVPLAELERRAILRALDETHGDKRLAAELLGISRAKVYQRLKEWREEE